MVDTVYIVLRHSDLETNGDICCIFADEDTAIRYTRSMNDAYAKGVILNKDNTDMANTPENDDVLKRTCDFCYYNYEVHLVNVSDTDISIKENKRLTAITTYEKGFTGRLNGEDDCKLVLRKSNHQVLINLDAICSIEKFERDDENYALIKLMNGTEYIIKEYDLNCLIQEGKL